MDLTNRYKRVPCGEIKVDRAKRQRQPGEELDTTDIDDSIRLRGVYQPIIIDRQMELVAGERRLCSSIKVGLPDIPVRFVDELTEVERQIIELEENLRRADLHWRDEVRSVQVIHNLYEGLNRDWNQEKTALALGMTSSLVSHYIRVAKELANPRIADAPGFKAALNILARVNDRAVADIVSSVMEAGIKVLQPTVQSGPILATPALPPVTQLAAEESVLQANFFEWAPQYKGPKFNLLHCDFPFGIQVFGGDWSGRQAGGTYDDRPEIYWALIECLGQNIDRLLSHSAHVIFWFSMDFYIETKEALRKALPSIEFQNFPLLWHKTDNVGIMPDPKRQPRRIYETALLGSRADRLLVKSVSNIYGAPTDKTHHPHTKPVPVLNHFLQMVVDEHTRLLDPTCGGGSALRSAEGLGAASVLGLELDTEHCASARSALRQFRILRSVKS